MALRHALADLAVGTCCLPQAERIADEQLAPEIEASRAPDVTASARGAVAKYVVPQPTQVKAGVYGFRPQDV
ncbi:hypothetical protein [Streptomyces mirabilis]|uniref:hypothetical protein n=1 Tax=Streptomyces mirabilis TaxID=68239 RepID=UPI0036DBFABF